MRVVIADDNLLVRKGIASLLAESGIEVAAEVNDADELLDAVAAHEPDIAIVDIRMPPAYTDEGLRAAHEIRARHPAMAIVVLSQHVEHGVATRVLTALDPLVMSRLLASDREGPLDALTARERDVLQLLAEGLSNPAIAERMGITLRSAEKYVSSIFAKLGLPDTGSEHRRVLAVLRFLAA
jgi:DNA-binding NarL/FixJ family response regulator